MLLTLHSSVYRIIAIVCFALCIMVVVYTTAATPTRVASRLGRRGMKRMEALAKNESWAQVEPLVRWLGVRISRFLPERVSAHLEHQILLAGDYLGLLAEELIAICILSSLLGAALGAGVDFAAETRGLASIGFATAGALGPYLQLTTLADDRKHKIGRGLPYAVDAMTLAMSAGLDFPGAIRRFVERAVKDDPLTEELEYLLNNLNLGHTRRAALVELAERCPSDPVKEFVHTVVQAEEKGTPLSEVLGIQATISRQRRTTRAEELAAKAGVKMALPLGLLLAALLAILVAPLLIKARQQLKSGSNDTHQVSATSRLV